MSQPVIRDESGAALSIFSLENGLSKLGAIEPGTTVIAPCVLVVGPALTLFAWRITRNYPNLLLFTDPNMTPTEWRIERVSIGGGKAYVSMGEGA